MLEHVLSAPGSPAYCQLHYNEAHHWIQATWQGFVDATAAHQGASTCLQLLRQTNCPYLLNDNSRLRGPWFDSLQWLSAEWGPGAARAGLRYVAHVAQPGTFATEYLGAHLQELLGHFAIQVFDHTHDAHEWLRACQLPPRAHEHSFPVGAA